MKKHFSEPYPVPSVILRGRDTNRKSKSLYAPEYVEGVHELGYRETR